MTEVGCPFEGDPPPDVLLDNTGVLLAFEPVVSGTPQVTTIADRQVVELDGVRVIILAEPALREQIAATVHAVEVDFAGCPASHPIAENIDWRPSAIDVATVDDIESVAACHYVLTDTPRETPPLTGSRLLASDTARELVAAIADAPQGSGPNAPETCLHGNPYAAVVLRVVSGAGTSEVVVRYSDCVGNGVDDGTQLRELTRDAATLIFDDALRPTSWGGHLSEVFEGIYPG